MVKTSAAGCFKSSSAATGGFAHGRYARQVGTSTTSWGGYPPRFAAERDLGGSGSGAEGAGDLQLSTPAEDAAVAAWPGGPAPAKKAKRSFDPRTHFQVQVQRPSQKAEPFNPCAIILEGSPPTVGIERPPENDIDRDELEDAIADVSNYA